MAILVFISRLSDSNCFSPGPLNPTPPLLLPFDPADCLGNRHIDNQLKGMYIFMDMCMLLSIYIYKFLHINIYIFFNLCLYIFMCIDIEDICINTFPSGSTNLSDEAADM